MLEMFSGMSRFMGTVAQKQKALKNAVILSLGLAFAAFSMGGLALASGNYVTQQSTRSLSFYNLHTHEKLDVTYWKNGRYDNAAMERLDYFLRDFRTGGETNMNPELMNLLFSIKTRLEARHPHKDIVFNVISGYRSPHTNSMLRARGGGQAKKSRHMLGEAMDIRVPGVSLTELRDTAWCTHSGGVGYYKGSNFVHVDVYKKQIPDGRFTDGERFRAWGWTPKPGQCG